MTRLLSPLLTLLILLILAPGALGAVSGARSLALIPASVDGEAPDTAGAEDALAGLSAWVADQSSGRFSLATRLAAPAALSGSPCNDLWSIADSARSQVGATEDYIGVLTPARCMYAGLGGGRAMHLDGTLSPFVVQHEFGHILSLGHANTGICPNLADLSTCQVTEYGDSLDVMGRDRLARDLSAAMRDQLGWGEAIAPGAGGAFPMAPRRYLKVDVARGTYYLEWIDREVETQKWVCASQCERERVRVRGLGVQGVHSGSSTTGLHDTLRPLPAPDRLAWVDGEVFHAPGIFRAEAREGTVSFSWDDVTAPVVESAEAIRLDNGHASVSFWARDEGSGVDGYELTGGAGSNVVQWSGTDPSEITVPLAARQLTARARDRAGNWSAASPITLPRPRPGVRVMINGSQCRMTCRPRVRGKGSVRLAISFPGAVRPAAGTKVTIRVPGALRKRIIRAAPRRGMINIRLTNMNRPRTIIVSVPANATTSSARVVARSIPRR